MKNRMTAEGLLGVLRVFPLPGDLGDEGPARTGVDGVAMLTKECRASGYEKHKIYLAHVCMEYKLCMYICMYICIYICMYCMYFKNWDCENSCIQYVMRARGRPNAKYIGPKNVRSMLLFRDTNQNSAESLATSLYII
jgi:hypothetical protein